MLLLFYILKDQQSWNTLSYIYTASGLATDSFIHTHLKHSKEAARKYK